MLILRRIVNLCSRRNYSSALYITGNKAQNQFSVLTPHLDYEDRLKHPMELEENVKLRGLDINLNTVEKQWIFYKYLETNREILEENKKHLTLELMRLLQNEDKNLGVIIKLKLQAKQIKGDLKVLNDHLYEIEEYTALAILALPNTLDPITPHDSEMQLHLYGEKPTQKSKSHLELAREQNLIQYTNSYSYYMFKEAALFELALINYFSKSFADLSFIQFSNSDFVRSIVVEGCADKFLCNSDVFTIETIHNTASYQFSRLHLTGGASLYPFMAYFTRNLVQSSFLPLKLFSHGRKYKPVNGKEQSLFNVSQETALEIFIAAKQENDVDVKLELIALIKRIYDALGYHYKIVLLPAKQLKLHESLRVSIQMYSSYLEKYVEVGNVSLCEDYLSKRLLCSYGEGEEKKFCKIISGTIVSVQKVLACILENNSLTNDPLLRKFFYEYVPS